MKRPRRTNLTLYALAANAVLLLCILIALLSGGSSSSMLPAAFGQVQGPIAGGAGIFVVPAQFSSNTWGCYVMDVDAQTLCAYQYYPGEKMLKLLAARNFKFDRRLNNFNTMPSPAEVADLVDKQNQTSRTAAPPSAPSPEALPKETP